MNNLTIIRGRPGSGKTTRLRKIERDAKAKGLNAAWVAGRVTEAGIEAMIQHGRNKDVVLFDDVEGSPSAATLDQIRDVAARHPDIQFAAAVAS